MKPFPRRYCAHDTYGWADCPRLAKVLWDRIRAQSGNQMTWYGTDLTIVDANTVQLFVYDIADNFHGGIGEQIHEETVTEFTKEEREILNRMVLEIYTELAEDELSRREIAEHNARVAAVRKQLFGV